MSQGVNKTVKYIEDGSSIQWTDTNTKISSNTCVQYGRAFYYLTVLLQLGVKPTWKFCVIFVMKCVLSFLSFSFVRMTGKQTTWQLHIILHGILTMSGVLRSKKKQKNLSMLMPTRTDLLGQNDPLLNSQQLVNTRKGQKM